MNKFNLIFVLILIFSTYIKSQSSDTINLNKIVEEARPIIVFTLDNANQFPIKSYPNYKYLTDDIAIQRLKNLIALSEKYYQKDLINTERLKNCKDLEIEYENLITITNERIGLYKSAFDEQKLLFNNLGTEFEKLQSKKTWKPWLKGLGSGFILALPLGIIGGIIIANK